MSKSLRNIIIAIGSLAVLIAAFVLFNSWKDRQMLKEQILRTESEMRFKQLAKDKAVLTMEKDSIMREIDNKQILIDYLENNPTIIIQNNDKAHLDINRLDAYNSIVRFSDNVSRYENNRDRYNLHRFNKNH